jgi:hypothetical protein
VGNVTDQEGLDSHTLTADSIYMHLINRHFGVYHNMQDSLDHIKYYNLYTTVKAIDPFPMPWSDLNQQKILSI